MDLKWIDTYSAIKAVLFLGIPGEEGCGALADILTGRINPSGKLGFTIAESYGIIQLQIISHGTKKIQKIF